VRFGSVPVGEAEGGIVAHATRAGDLTLRKGDTVTAAHVERLRAAGIGTIMVARLEPGDVPENDAAGRLAAVAAGTGVRVDAPFTGRANLFATAAGVLSVDAPAIDAANAIDEAITVATLPHRKAVVAGEMVATVKIIPFAVPKGPVASAAHALRASVRVSPYRACRLGVISTLLPALKTSVVEKTVRVLDERLAAWQAAGTSRVADIRVPHEQEELAEAVVRAGALGLDVAVVFGASAITDRRDVIPAAIEAAGGTVECFGMPVDPGNLLLLGRVGPMTVLGAPGCARSPKENGFDWVLQRLLAGLPVGRADIQAMGVGGLLMEIVSRPLPRETGEAPPRKVAGLVLAAGRSARMGRNKLVEETGGLPMVRRAALAALDAGLSPVLAVTGHESDRIVRALEGLSVKPVHNARYAEGMSTSLAAGLAALPADVEGAVVLLGDMPEVDAGIVRRLASAFAAEPDAPAVVPVSGGRRGNPALLGRALFPQALGLSGDTGARALLAAAGEGVVEVEVADGSVLTDLDTPEALEAWRSRSG
jgi:molybdenum cofactor cytidylyltransferase